MDCLEQEMGWDAGNLGNKEDFGVGGRLGRDSENDAVLKHLLRANLEDLNPELPSEALDDAVRQLTEVMASQDLVAANRSQYKLMRDGVPVIFNDDEGKETRGLARVFDFERPENNHFLCIREFRVKGAVYERRADIIGFVNGLPLLFIECKNIHRNLRTAFDGNFSDYKDTVPYLFYHNAVVMFCNGDEGKIGSITSQWEHFHEWKRLDEGEKGAVNMETLLKGVCDKRNFMDILENFILFDESSGDTRKILARNHQFLGVNRAVEAVTKRRERKGKLGVFWHTQGAGKSYSMVFFTRKVHRKLGGNFTFLVLTDREDLDTQIYKTFAGCGLVSDGDSCRAESSEGLKQLLSEQKKHVFSLIQKFQKSANPHGGPYTLRDDVIVITDEAHRTQYGELADNMRDALPNAAYIGFTGTPLFKDDEITRRVFGEYVSTYDFQRAVEDQATVPLFYSVRGEKLNVAIGDLNERIAEHLEKAEIEDVDVQQRLERDLKRDYHVITSKKRLDQVARDFVQHYSTAWETGKAMLICIDKLTCVRMHELIMGYWKQRIPELEAQRDQCDDGREENELERQIQWMRETEVAVVISEEQGEVERFRKERLDIIPHRRLIKEGFKLPPAMCEQPQYRNMQRMELDEAFKCEEHPFRIAIVCAMWLTGFDVPCLGSLYLDKPLKDHTLMQAIARANRVKDGKNNGMIIDYCGILKRLRKALATFAVAQPDGSPLQIDLVRPEEELLEELKEAITQVRRFLEKGGAPLDVVINQTGFERNAAIRDCKEAVNQNDETRKRFEILCREVFKKFKACINIPDAREYREERQAINIIYQSLQKDREQADISDIRRQLKSIVDESIEGQTASSSEEPSPVYDVSKIDFKRLRQEFAARPGKHTDVQSLKDALEKKLQRMLAQNPLRTDFQRRYEEIVLAYNREKDRFTVEQTFEALLKFMQELDEEEKRSIQEGLDEETLAIFDLLKKPDLKPSDIQKIKKTAGDLLDALKKGKLRNYQWCDKESTRDEVRVTIHDFLWAEETGLPTGVYSNHDIEDRTEKVFLHVFRAYPKLPSPVYGDITQPMRGH